MKKHQQILKGVLFIAILYGIMSLLTPIFRPKSNSRKAGMDFAEANGILGEADNTVDVILVGDSEVYNAFSPMEMWNDAGITSYDSATGAQQIFESYQYIKQAFTKQRLKVVIIETNLLYRKLGFDNFFYTRFSNFFGLMRYHDRWKSLSAEDFGGSETKYDWTDYMKGFRYFPKTDGINPGTYMKPTTESRTFNRYCGFYLKKIEDLCTAYGAKLLFVSTPSTKNWNMPRHNGVEKYAKEHGLDYLDMNLLSTEEFPLDWSTDTKDQGDHLNFQGAVKASAYLAEYLQEKYGLEDHRDDPEYASWNAAYEQYKKKVEIE